MLGKPIVELIFQRGEFMPADTTQVVRALDLYLIGLVPASLDWLLNYAFYARNNTLTPALVGVASVGIYLVVALTLVKPFGYLGLVFANSAKHTGHFLIMLVLLRRQLGTLRDLQGGVTALRTLAAAGVMAVLLLVMARGLTGFLPSGFEGNLILVLLGGALGAAVYFVVAQRLGVEEAGMLVGRFMRRIPHRR